MLVMLKIGLSQLETPFGIKELVAPTPQLILWFLVCYFNVTRNVML